MVRLDGNTAVHDAAVLVPPEATDDQSNVSSVGRVAVAKVERESEVNIAEDMKDEIDAAVSWWSQQLQGTAQHDVGDSFNSMFASIAQSAMNLQPLPPGQIQAFEAALRNVIIKMIEKSGIDLSDPSAGSYNRVLSTDYGPEEELAYAANKAGIRGAMFRFPMKTVMWINPGEVSVRPGYGAETITIYPRK